MREINVQEMCQVLDSYLGKRVEVGTNNPIWSVNTYQSFRFSDTDNVLIFSDYDVKNGRQELLVDKNQITEIILTEGKDIYSSVISIELINGQIDFCISEMPTKCYLCHKIIDTPYETRWSIGGGITGGYGSKFEDDKLDIPVCEHCLCKIIGCGDGEDSE